MEYITVSQQNFHVQGFAKGGDHMYFSFTDSLVKTTLTGTIRCQVQVHGGHLGDVDYYHGKIYGCWMGEPLPEHAWDDWTGFCVHEYDAEDLRLLRVIPLKKCEEYWAQRTDPADRIGFAGIDGITIGPDPATGEPKIMQACQMLVGEKYEDHIILQFDMDGHYETEYHFPLGNTTFGIQNLDYDWEKQVYWAVSYGPQHPWQCQDTMFCFSGDLKTVLKQFRFGMATGLECLGEEGFYQSIELGKNGARACIAFKCDEAFMRAYPFNSDAAGTDIRRILVEAVTGEKVVDGKFGHIIVKD